MFSVLSEVGGECFILLLIYTHRFTEYFTEFYLPCICPSFQQKDRFFTHLNNHLNPLKNFMQSCLWFFNIVFINKIPWGWWCSCYLSRWGFASDFNRINPVISHWNPDHLHQWSLQWVDVSPPHVFWSLNAQKFLVWKETEVLAPTILNEVNSLYFPV